MHVATSVDELLAGATDRLPLDGPGKSGALLERVTIDGEPYVVKYLDHDADWTLRVANIPGSATVELWRRGILARIPGCFNQPIVAVAHDTERPTLAALLMHDVGEWLVPATDAPITLEQHERFLDHMADLHATFWENRIEIVSPTDRYLELSPRMAAAEAAIGSDHLVPRLVAQGWPLLEEVAPALARVVVPLVHDPAPLLDALATTPSTFVHGNWKLDNLGTTTSGSYRAPRLGAARHGRAGERPGVVPRDQLPPAPHDEGGNDRVLPRGARAPRHRDRPLVGPPARPLPDRRDGPVRLGEGARRVRRRARVVGGAGPCRPLRSWRRA